jgi:hypothetical protein
MLEKQGGVWARVHWTWGGDVGMMLQRHCCAEVCVLVIVFVYGGNPLAARVGTAALEVGGDGGLVVCRGSAAQCVACILGVRCFFPDL